MAGGSHAARSAHADTAHINKLETEISDIKQMLSDYGVKNTDRRDKIASLLDDEEGAVENYNNNVDSNSASHEFVKQQR